jgi:hypothetical protein
LTKYSRGKYRPSGVIDPESGDCACAHQLKNKAVNGVEDLWQFHADRGQIVYVEKAAVINFLSSDAPKRQTIRLCIEQFIELVKTARVARIPIDLGESFLDGLLYLRCFGATTLKPPFDDFPLSSAFCDPFWVGFSAFRQIFKGGQNALQFRVKTSSLYSARFSKATSKM